MVNGEKLVISVKPMDDRGCHLVVARMNGTVHPHRFDALSQFHRKQYRDAVVDRFGLDDSAHEWLEEQILNGAAAADSGAVTVTPNIITMADVVEKPVHWLWDHYIPQGAIVDLSGDPNEGKSTIAIDIVARLSRGDSMPPTTSPDGTFTPGSSLLLSGEDDAERTVKPRLVAAGACVERVYLLRTVTVCDEQRPVQLPMDLPLIERLIVERKISIVVIDVLAAFTEPNTSLNDDAAMRRLFNPMSGVCERTGAALLMIRHMNKKENTKAMYRGGGSIAITGASRAAFAVAPNPDDPSEKVFVPIKHNLGPRPHSLTYRIEAAGNSSHIVWGGHSNLTADDVLKHHETAGGNKTNKAKCIIVDLLSNGPRGENEVKAACDAAGASNSTYWRARKWLRVLSERAGFGSSGQWMLSLPSTNGEFRDQF